MVDHLRQHTSTTIITFSRDNMEGFDTAGNVLLQKIACSKQKWASHAEPLRIPGAESSLHSFQVTWGRSKHPASKQVQEKMIIFPNILEI